MLFFALKTVSWLSLGLLMVPTICFVGGMGDLSVLKTLMLIATIVWFAAAALAALVKSDANQT
ncbi:MAG: hypothetical protein ABIK28_00505 [Planctomycetota bacterium]